VKRNLRTIVIETPEHFEIEFQLAGIGMRFLAYFVDRMLQACIILSMIASIALLMYMTGKVINVTDFLAEFKGILGQWIIATGIILYGIIAIGYFILFEYFWSGCTPGKMFQSIRVIRKDGRPITLLDSAIRNILRFVDLFAGVYPIGVLVMFLDSRNRRLGDIAAGTLVIVEDRSREPFIKEKQGPTDEPESDLKALVAGMTSEDYLLVTRFLSRRSELDDISRQNLAQKIVGFLTERSGPVPRGYETEQLLETLHKMYMDRTRIL
jgi:uncharacterized RDD family membrane protein YckC